MYFRAEGRQLFTFVPVSDTRHGFKSPYSFKNALPCRSMLAWWQSHMDEKQWHTHIHFSFFLCTVPYSLSLSSFSSICPHFSGNLENFYSSLKLLQSWELKIKAKSASHSLGETGPSSLHSSPNPARVEGRQQSWAHMHLLGKQHVNFTVISFALPISSSHIEYFKFTPNAIQRIPQYPDLHHTQGNQLGSSPHW